MRTIDCTDEYGSRCNYCGKAGMPDAFKATRITTRDREPISGQSVVVTKLFTVCVEGACAGNLQMAHEG